MTQSQIEELNQEEYCNFLSYGDPKITDIEVSAYDQVHIEYDNRSHSRPEGVASAWISTLESTTYPGLTFGYIDAL